MLAEFGVGQVLWSMMWFFLFFVWIMLLFQVFIDIFRSPDLSGFAKVMWVLFVVILPYLGVFVYLIARGKKMGEHAVRDAQARDDQMRAYVQGVTSSSTSAAEEIEKLHGLQASGAITPEEFAQAKAKLLA